MPIRELNPIDPRNIDHPLHDEKWLALARAIGRLEAREEYELLQRHKGQPSDGTQARHPH